MAYSETHTTGIMLSHESKYGTEYVNLQMMQRRTVIRDGIETVETNPISPRDDYDSPLSLDGLGVQAHAWASNQTVELIGLELGFKDCYYVTQQKIEKQLKAIKRANAQIEKDCSRTISEIYMSLVRAFKCDFAVVMASPERVSRTGDKWHFMSIAAGKGELERLVEHAIGAEKTRQNIAA